MPKLAVSETQKRIDVVQANIRSRCAYFGCTTEEKISERIGISKGTYHYRKVKGNWTVEEIIRAAFALKVQPEWLLADHSKIEEVRGNEGRA